VPNRLNLPQLTVTKECNLDAQYKVYAKAKTKTKECPMCTQTEIVRYGKYKSYLHDIPIKNKPTVIIFARSRYRCNSCRKTFLERVPYRYEQRMMTERLIEFIKMESVRRSMCSIAKEIGVHEKTIRDILKE